VPQSGRRARWLEEPEEKDYAAARGCLSPLLEGPMIDRLIAALAAAPAANWRAKDVLRASRVALLSPGESAEVAEKAARIRDKEPISPILLVVLRPDVVVQIADGYHRTCAAFFADEDTIVPGRIAFLE
jgi:hypothetical protein